MSEPRSLDPSGYPPVTAPRSFGKPVRLEWLALSALVIDPEYQREITHTGRRNVVVIASSFDWARFVPVIVAPAGSNRFAIVDGQHRATAAMLCGIEKVPCAIIDGARAVQAAAFCAINTVATAMNPLQVHAARLAAGDAQARKLTAALAQAGAVICRYKPKSGDMKSGETLAAGKLYQLHRRFDEATFIAAVSCITRTRDGYPGFLRAQIVEAFCAVLEAEPSWRDSPRLLKAIGKIDIAAAYGQARKDTEGSRGGVIAALIDVFCGYLEKALA